MTIWVYFTNFTLLSSDVLFFLKFNDFSWLGKLWNKSLNAACFARWAQNAWDSSCLVLCQSKLFSLAAVTKQKSSKCLHVLLFKKGVLWNETWEVKNSNNLALKCWNKGKKSLLMFLLKTFFPSDETILWIRYK